jgi:DNA-binding winged helix-turn-helix (wHTH) protein
VTADNFITCRFGAFELDLRERVLRRHGTALPLRSRPFDLLAALVARAGQLISKDELLDLAWPGVVVEENNLQVQVSVLRKLLGPDSIVTVPGRGYRFVLPVDTAATSEGAGRSAGKLPPVPPALIGRDEDIAALCLLVSRERLVTVHGPGGIGKTRLAQTVAHAIAVEFGGQVTWVDLSPIVEPALLDGHVCAALDAVVAPGQSTLDAIVEQLGPARQILVFDNLEHLVAAAAELVATLLDRLPALHIVVTSQAPLRNSGEHIYRLDPLASLRRASASTTHCATVR